MNDVVFLNVSSRLDLERVYPVIRELRTELNYDDFLSLYDRAHAADGYEIIALERGGQILAAMGYRILYDFVHYKHLYIDDLVCREKFRSQGWGGRLLDYAEELANHLECKGLRLCARLDNERAKTFYEQNAWQPRSLAYKKAIPTSPKSRSSESV